MLISSESVNFLAEKISSLDEVFCSGLFLSARWFVVSQLDYDGIQLVVLPDKESAEYCAADLYNLIEGDNVFFLPDSGKSLEKSNYKSSLGVQRTSAVGRILDHKEGQLVIVSYPSALEEGVPQEDKIRQSVMKLKVGDVLHCNGKSYALRRVETILFRDTPLYCWGLCVERGETKQWPQS